MLLTPGQRLSSYEITAMHGKGGMGEVYRARDPQLDRDVAIKVLPAEFTGDEERLLRFRREARLLASLQHPRIAAVHGFETVDTDGGGPLHLLVLEFVAGTNLSERLQNGPLPVDEALELGVQVAEGLEAAHDKGIVHRDLKPANVMLDHDGNAKVLDFGLARAAADQPSTSGAAAAESPTITADYTQPGVLLGTAPYMSPEQARGRAVDRRTDVWAFGCVLYECLTGRMAFRGESATETLGAILHREPDWSLLPPAVPPVVRLLLRRCLTKDRNRRLQAIADARVELQEAIADPTSSAIGLSGPAPAAGRGRLVSTVAAMLAAAAVTAAVMTLLQEAPAEPVVQRYSIVLPEGLRFTRFWQRPFDVSADGRTLVVLATQDGGEQQLYVRDAADPEFRPLATATGDPAVSANGEWVSHDYDNNGIVQVAIRGGAAVRLLARDVAPTVCWQGNEWVYFTDADTETGGGAFTEVGRVPAGGGAVEIVGSGVGYWVAPQVLPGDTVLVSHRRWLDREEQIAVVSGASGMQPLIEGASPCWSPTGHLLFVRRGTLMAARYDPHNLTLGPAVPLLEGIATSVGGAAYTMTAAGTLYHIAGPGYGDADEELVRVGPDGTVTALPVRARPYGMCRVEPLGRRIAVTTAMTSDEPGTIVREGTALSVLDPERDIMTRLTSDRGSMFLGPWSPRRDWIYYTVMQMSGYVAHRIRTDGSSEPEPIPGGEGLFVTSITADGSHLFGERRGILDDSGDMVSLSIDEDFRVDATFGRGSKPAVSPYGRWLAFASRRNWGGEVFITAINGSGDRIQVSRDGGTDPRWSVDGTRLYFVGTGGVPMVVDVTQPGGEESTGAPTLSAPRELYRVPDGVRGTSEALPDEQGFLATRVVGVDEDERHRDEIVVTLHFDKVIERLVDGKE